LDGWLILVAVFREYVENVHERYKSEGISAMKMKELAKSVVWVLRCIGRQNERVMGREAAE
jgi:hypothetical protein